MNRPSQLIKFLAAAGLAGALAAGLPALAAPAPPAAISSKSVPRSVFVIPKNPSEGCDPFFPTSTRPYEIQTTKTHVVADVTSLVLKGISGPLNNRLAIINNQTFGVGDEGDVVTPAGRLHIRCLEINDDSVVVESGGQRHELKYQNKP